MKLPMRILPFPLLTILMVMLTSAVQRGKALIDVVTEVCLKSLNKGNVKL